MNQVYILFLKKWYKRREILRHNKSTQEGNGITGGTLAFKLGNEHALYNTPEAGGFT